MEQLHSRDEIIQKLTTWKICYVIVNMVLLLFTFVVPKIGYIGFSLFVAGIGSFPSTAWKMSTPAQCHQGEYKNVFTIIKFWVTLKQKKHFFFLSCRYCILWVLILSFVFWYIKPRRALRHDVIGTMSWIDWTFMAMSEVFFSTTFKMPVFCLAEPTRGVCLKLCAWSTGRWGCVLCATLRAFRVLARCPCTPAIPAPPGLVTTALTTPVLH